MSWLQRVRCNEGETKNLGADGYFWRMQGKRLEQTGNLGGDVKTTKQELGRLTGEAKDCSGQENREVKVMDELSREEWETAGCPAVMSWKLITPPALELGVITGKRDS